MNAICAPLSAGMRKENEMRTSKLSSGRRGRAFWLAVGAQIAFGCQRTAPSPPERVAAAMAAPVVPGQGGALDRDRVVAIARQAIEDRGEPVDGAEFREPKRGEGGLWSVSVWIHPHQSFGDRLIIIDANGKVAHYWRGK
jgi:hypothetical protein